MSICFSFGNTSSALAHGGPPAVEGVLASDDHGPWLIELSEGFALRSTGDAWSFVCPALFASDQPPLSAAPAEQAFVAGGMDLFRMSSEPSLTALNRPDLAGSRVVALGALEGALLALRFRPAAEGGGSELVRWQNGALESLFVSSAVWSSFAVQPTSFGQDAQLWLARIEGDGLALLELSASGEEQATTSVPLLETPLSIRLSAAGDHLFAHVFDNTGYSLLYVAARGEPAFEAQVVARATLPVRGPVVRGAEILLTRDTDLLSWSPGSLELSESALGTMPLTCLAPDYACTQSRLYESERVEEAGALDPKLALFDLADLAGPSQLPEDPELSRRCTAQWLVFRSDLVRAGIELSDPGVPGQDPDAGVGDAGAIGSLDASADAAIEPDATPELDATADAGGPTSSAASGGGGGCSAISLADVAKRMRTPWLSLLGYAAALYLRRRRAHPPRIIKVKPL